MEYTVGTTVLDGWEICRLLGEGAYGKVFEVQKDNYGVKTMSALKVIRIPQSSSDIRSALSEGMDEQSVTSYFHGFVEEIMHEIAVMSTVKDHPNIVSYEDHHVVEYPDEVRWDILIRMELLTPLINHEISRHMDVKDVVRLGRELSSALAYCQRSGLIHRDIKPENIFVSRTGQFKLGDFGVSRTVEKTTGGLSKKGTESYMAPEVYLGQPYGATVDIYSLGLVLYRFLNRNRLPFLPPAPQQITFAARQNAIVCRMRGEAFPPPVDADEKLTAILNKACAFQAKDRYTSAAEMLDALNEYAGISSGYSNDFGFDGLKQSVDHPTEPSAFEGVEYVKKGAADSIDDEGTVGAWGSAANTKSLKEDGEIREEPHCEEATIGAWGQREETGGARRQREEAGSGRGIQKEQKERRKVDAAIDLGTANTRVAYIDEAENRIVTVNRRIPSVIGFTRQGERVFGERAYKERLMAPDRIIDVMQCLRERKSLRIDGQEYGPELLLTMYLSAVKEEVENQEGINLDVQMIAVPWDFNQNQRNMIRNSCKAAGIVLEKKVSKDSTGFDFADVDFGDIFGDLFGRTFGSPARPDEPRIVSDISGGAFCCGCALQTQEDCNIMLCDIGAGTLEVTVLEVGGDVVSVLTVRGTDRYSGNVIREHLVGYMVREFYQRSGINLNGNLSAMTRLRDSAEQVLRTLSVQREAYVSLPWIVPQGVSEQPWNLEMSISQHVLSEIIKTLQPELIQTIQGALRDVGAQSAIEFIYVAGGAAGVLGIADQIAQIMGREVKTVPVAAGTENVAVFGAALRVAKLAGKGNQGGADDCLMLDVCPLNVNVIDERGQVIVSSENNTTTPTQKSTFISVGKQASETLTSRNNVYPLNSVFRITEGKSADAASNEVIETFDLFGFARDGVPAVSQIQIELEIKPFGVITYRLTANASAESKKPIQDRPKAEQKQSLDIEAFWKGRLEQIATEFIPLVYYCPNIPQKHLQKAMKAAPKMMKVCGDAGLRGTGDIHPGGDWNVTPQSILGMICSDKPMIAGMYTNNASVRLFVTKEALYIHSGIKSGFLALGYRNIADAKVIQDVGFGNQKLKILLKDGSIHLCSLDSMKNNWLRFDKLAEALLELKKYYE